MTVEIRVPQLGESVAEATVGQWYKSVGDAVEKDEAILELETDKVTLEVNAAEAGVLSDISVDEGDTVEVGHVLGHIDANGKAQPKPKAESKSEATPEPEPEAGSADGTPFVLPAAQKLIDEKGLDPSRISGTGKDGRITKGDVLAFVESGGQSAKTEAPKKEARPPAPRPEPAPDDASRETRVRMTRLRRRIAERLKEAQDTAAMLTTFNEVDMTELLETRKAYKEAFEKKHGVKLGFMSFFAKACIAALKELPAVNAEIDGDDIVYKNYYHVGVAVGTPQGLVVPVLRNVDRMSYAEIETSISDLGRRARDGKLSLDELTGGTFTISNGGVYGSLMSTPILNPPQSGILGMHKIQQRPMVVDGEIKVRPMMYLALSYDHRIIDGREAVTFLVRVKEYLEDSRRLLLDI